MRGTGIAILAVATLSLVGALAAAGCTQVRDAGDAVAQTTQKIGDGVWTGTKSVGNGVVSAGRDLGNFTAGAVQSVGKLGQKNDTGLRPPLPPDPCQQFGANSNECAQDRATLHLVSRETTIYFVAGEIKITPDQRAQLTTLAARVRGDANMVLYLEAYAERGEARNATEATALATQRGRVVREALMADGVPGDRVVVDVRGWNIATFSDSPNARRVAINLISRR